MAARKKRTLDAEFVPIADVTPYERNPRKVKKAVASVSKSLEQFDWQQPIVVDVDKVVIVGHARLAAAQALGMTEVPIRIASNLTPEQVRAYRIADNRTGEDADWNRGLLVAELSALEASEVDLATTGFNETQLNALLGEPVADEPDDEFDQPKPVPKYTCPSCGYKWSGGAEK